MSSAGAFERQRQIPSLFFRNCISRGTLTPRSKQSWDGFDGYRYELQYNPQLAAMGFRSPLLRGTIHDRSVLFLIDTGAVIHTLASWLVNEAHIGPHTKNRRPKGSTLVESPVKAVYGEEIHVNGRKSDLRLQEAIVVEFPAIFEGQRIGGLLSPQLLAPARLAAILD